MLECPLRFPSDGPNRNPNRRRRAAFHPPAVSRASPRVPGPLGGALRELVEMEGVPGGSDGGGIGSDWEVGTIVWVRRRNGSWWPGRILGQHELSASHLMSPRSGTPVKLLGREDASVDWYNLEKSKRVKVFRCGEFDACIERAEASQGFPIKKREKYARREDAILHALELEKHMLERRHQRLGNNFSKKLSGSLRKEQSVDFPTTSGIMSDETPVTCKPINYRKVDSTLPRATKGTTFAGKWKSDILFSHEDHKSDVVLALRKKGLQDAGLPAISSKRKLAASGSYGSSKIPFLVANIMHSPPSSMKDMDGWIDDGRSKICLPVERRSQISASKAWEKCRPQVIHDTIEFPASEPMLSCGYESDLLPVWQTHFENQGFVERENLSPGLLEPYESDLSERLYLDSDVEHDASSLPSTSKTFVSQLVNSGRKSESDRQKLHTQVLAAMRKKNATLLSGQSTGSSAEAGVSRWNLKRKRNIRRISRSAVKSIGVNDVVSHEDKRCIHNVGRGGNTAETGFDSQTDDSCDSDLIEKGPETAFYFTGDVGYKPVFYGNSVDSKENSMDDSDRDSCEMSLSGWDAEKQLHAPRRQWEWPAQQLGYFYSGSFSDTLELRLVDVDLKVHTSYLGERVPLISLMSRLDGKAIVGHPVQIEILSDGFIATLLTEADYGETTAPAGWPTARRTTLSRIPRPHTASSSVEDVEVGVLHFSDHESRVPLKSDRITFVQKGSHGHGPSKKLQKKSSKKASESNLKTRTLSSLAKRQKNSSSHKQSGEASGKACSLGKLIEPGDAVPFVTCVPTKVLFSRILEAVGRSPSTVAMQT